MISHMFQYFLDDKRFMFQYIFWPISGVPIIYFDKGLSFILGSDRPVLDRSVSKFCELDQLVRGRTPVTSHFTTLMCFTNHKWCLTRTHDCIYVVHCSVHLLRSLVVLHWMIMTMIIMLCSICCFVFQIVITFVCHHTWRTPTTNNIILCVCDRDGPRHAAPHHGSGRVWSIWCVIEI